MVFGLSATDRDRKMENGEMDECFVLSWYFAGFIDKNKMQNINNLIFSVLLIFFFF